jgi:hypothetical protein
MIASEFLKPVDLVLQKFPLWRQIGLDTKDLKRLLYLECEINRKLLDCLQLDASPGISQTAPAFLKVSVQLRTNALELVLGLDDKASKTFKQLARTLANPKDDEDAGATDSDGGLSLAEKLQRVYTSATVAKELAGILMGTAEPPTGMKNVNFRSRLNNLRDSYIQMSAAVRMDL